jgi:dihydrofolate reductase
MTGLAKEIAMSRKMIAALQVSLDGFTQGPDRGERDWVDSWADALGQLDDVDAFVQGAGMYPGYAEYWAAIEKDPKAVAPYSTRPPYDREIAYARFAAKTPHYVLSTTLSSVSWPRTASVVRSVDALRALKASPGKNIYVVGGATLVVSLLNHDLLDELRLIVQPILLGGGRALFAGIEKWRSLRLTETGRTESGAVVLSYRL